MAGDVSDSRWAAFRILLRVEKQGGFAADLLHSPLTAGLEEHDLALAEELTLGVLRRQALLDRWIAEVSGRPAEKLDAEVRLALRLGAYQLRRLDRIPARAAVSESVEITRRARKASAAGLVNAVLRKIASRPGAEQPGLKDVAECAVPRWLLERWREHFGTAEAQEIALATLDPPPTYVRLNAQCDAEETVRLLAAEGVDTEPTELPFCRRVRSGRPERTECFRQGRVRIQDLGSQRVAPLLTLDARHRFLDLCAAPGGKTFQALEQRGTAEGRGSIPAVACDLSPHRLQVMRRLATMPVALVALDASRPLPFAALFDRILVDAPCSGTGTLARNPEIKWRLKPQDIEDLATRQRAILSRALDSLERGGRLVYATCSLEPEENEAVVDAVLPSGYVKCEMYQWLPGRQGATEGGPTSGRGALGSPQEVSEWGARAADAERAASAAVCGADGASQGASRPSSGLAGAAVHGAPEPAGRAAGVSQRASVRNPGAANARPGDPMSASRAAAERAGDGFFACVIARS